MPQLLLGAIRDQVRGFLEDALDSMSIRELILKQWRNHYVPLRIKGEALTIDHERDLPEYGEFDTEEADDEA